MNAYRIEGLSDRSWIMTPAHQVGVTVRLECPTLLTDEGRPTWVLVNKARLRPLKGAARVSDPVTSHQAAAAQTPAKMRDAHRAILAVLLDHGPCTDFDLARHVSAAIGKTIIPTSIGVRRKELATLGLVADSGHKGKSDTGSPAIRWALTNSGRQELAA
jgi:hypothetical protein